MTPPDFQQVSRPPEDAPLLRSPVFWVALAVVVGLALGLHFWLQRGTEEEGPVQTGQLQPPASPTPDVAQAPSKPPSPPISEKPSEPQVRYPVPQVEPPPGMAAKPLPPLNQSDDAMQASLAKATESARAFDDINLSEDLIRHVVATIDNLPRRQVATRLLPLVPPRGDTAVAVRDGVIRLSPTNYARYARFVSLGKAIDTKRLVSIYVHFYPLFQQAYVELGYPNGYFNDRMVEVIDHLVAAPELKQPPELVEGKIFYEFADPQLEALSAGQKLMIRVGSRNAAEIKAKLREIRAELVAQAPAAER